MKYYSEKTDKIYNSVDELTKAEKAYDDANAEKIKAEKEKEAAYKEVEDAAAAVEAAFNIYSKKLKEYNDKYNCTSALSSFFSLFI